MVTVRVNAASAITLLKDVEKKQAPYAVSLALNRLANDVQAEIRKGMEARFKMRRRAFNLQGVYISKADRATKTSWVVTIRIAENRSFFNKFEEGGDKLPVNGTRMLAVPSPALANRVLMPGDPLRPKNLELKKIGNTWRGKERTFIMHFYHGNKLGIMQRMESGHPGYKAQSMSRLNLNNFGTKNRGLVKRQRRYGERGYRLLYTLVSRVKVKAKLEFRQTGQTTVARQWTPRWNQALAQALRTAR